MTRTGAALTVGCLLALTACGGSGSEASPSEGLLAVNGTQLWVKRLGAGAPIVVVHGGPVLDHSYLLPHLEPLARDYELIFFDQRLSGRSAPEVDPESLQLATFAEDIEELRRQLGLERFHLMAHSWGGLLAIRYAIAHSDRIDSLVLLSPMAASSALWQEEERLLAARISDEEKSERRAIVESEAYKARQPAAIAEILRLSFRPQFHDPEKLDRLDLYVPEDYAERSFRFARLGGELSSFDLHVDAGRIEVPTLLLYGEAEPGAELGGKALDEALPASRRVLVERAGHFPFIERPDATLEVIREFLGTLAG